MRESVGSVWAEAETCTETWAEAEANTWAVTEAGTLGRGSRTNSGRGTGRGSGSDSDGDGGLNCFVVWKLFHYQFLIYLR